MLNFLEARRPPIVALENVLGLVYQKGKKAATGVLHDLDEKGIQPNIRLLIEALENLGYTTTVTIIDPRDYGVPQHRLRTWVLVAWTPCSITNMTRSVEATFNSMRVITLDIESFLLDEGTSQYQEWKAKEECTCFGSLPCSLL